MIRGRDILLGFLREHRLRVGIAFGAGLLARLAALLLPLVIGRFLALHFGYATFRGSLLQELPESWLGNASSFLVLLLAVSSFWFLCRYLERFQTLLLGELLVKQIREDLFRIQLRTQAEAFAQRNVGKYLLRYSGDLRGVQNLVSLGIMGFLRDMLLLIPAVILFGMILPELALPCTIGFVALLLPLAFLNRVLYRASLRRRDRRSGMLAHVSERLYRHQVIQALNRENPEVSRFEKRSDRLTDAGRQYFRIEALIRTLIPTLVYLLPGLLFWYLEGSPQLPDPESLSLGALLLIAMVPVFQRIARVTVHWELGKLSLRKLLAVMNLPTESRDQQPDVEFQHGKLAFENLGLARIDQPNPPGSWNLELGPTGITWIEGPTGAGKTQLIRTLMQHVQPSDGQILLDGQDLAAHNPKSIRRHIAVVSEAWPLMGKNVFEAISYSRKKAKREGAGRMLDKVQAGLPPGIRLELDSPIGDLGSRLSGGQHMLLLFARAFLTRKPILILDEAFVALDEPSTRIIVRRLQKLRLKKNIIILSSRPPLDALKADRHCHFNGQNPTEDHSQRYKSLFLQIG